MTVGPAGMRKKQIDINHTQESISQGHRSVGQVRWEQRDRNWRNHMKNHRPQMPNQSRTGCETLSGHVIIAACKEGGRGMHRRSRGGRDMQTRNGEFVIAEQVRRTRPAKHLWTTAGVVGPRVQQGGLRGRSHGDRGDSGVRVLQLAHGSRGVRRIRAGKGASRGPGKCQGGRRRRKKTKQIGRAHTTQESSYNDIHPATSLYKGREAR
jgi:hypothetical protein